MELGIELSPVSDKEPENVVDMRLALQKYAAQVQTWTRFVQLVYELYPVSDKDPEKQVDMQQDLDDYPVVTGGRSIKTDTAHFKIDGVLNPDYTTRGLPYSCYITAILHSGAFSKDFIES